MVTKRLLKILILSFLLIGLSETSQAQFWKKLKQKAQEKISKTEDKIINKIDENTDKQIDDTLNGTKQETLKEIPNTFSFDKSLEIEITSNNTDAVKMEFLFGNRNDVYAISINEDQMGNQGTMYNVITPTSATLFMNMSGMKIKKSIPLDQFSDTNYADNISQNKDSLQKTGATKTILGYNCEEYKYVNEKGYVAIWVTKDFPVETANIPMLGMSENSLVDGFVLELNTKSGKEFAKVAVVKFNLNKKVTIDTKTYKSMGI